MLKKTKLFKLSLASQAREAEAAAWCSTAWAISYGLWILWKMQLVHAGLREGWLNTTNSTLHTCNVPFSMSHLLLPGQTSCLDITPVQLLSAWISPWRFLLCGKASQWLPWLLRESWECARHNDATQLVFSYYKIGCLHCSRSCEAWFATARWHLLPWHVWPTTRAVQGQCGRIRTVQIFYVTQVCRRQGKSPPSAFQGRRGPEANPAGTQALSSRCWQMNLRPAGLCHAPLCGVIWEQFAIYTLFSPL